MHPVDHQPGSRSLGKYSLTDPVGKRSGLAAPAIAGHGHEPSVPLCGTSVDSHDRVAAHPDGMDLGIL